MTGSHRFIEGFLGWVALGFPFTFLIWVERFHSQSFQTVEVGVQLYLSSLVFGWVLAGLFLGILRVFKSRWWSLGWVGYGSVLFYIGFLKTLNVEWVPWLGVAGWVVFTLYGVYGKKHLAAQPSLVVIHAIGTLSGLYMTFHLTEFLKGWEPFLDVVQGLWMVMSRGLFKVF